MVTPEIQTRTHVIRLAVRADIPEIMSFIGHHYREDHILARDRAMFEYEFLTEARVNGALAVHQDTGAIEAVWMFYQTREQLEGSDLFGGLWSVAKDCRTPMLGYKLVSSVYDLTGVRSHSSIGIDPGTTGRIFSHVRGQQVMRASHYYRLADRADYRIAAVRRKDTRPIQKGTDVTLHRFRDARQMQEAFTFPDPAVTFPAKDARYVTHRYFAHPVYEYRVYGLQRAGRTEALLVCRIVEANGATAFRIVDFIGREETLADAGEVLQREMDDAGCEYADFYEYGLQHETLTRMGFTLRDEQDPNIIPNYFEPFEQKNVDLWCHTSEPRMHLFKADADQDRPNRIVS